MSVGKADDVRLNAEVVIVHDRHVSGMLCSAEARVLSARAGMVGETVSALTPAAFHA